MKKKSLVFIVISIVIFSFAFTGCGEEPVNKFVGEWEPVSVISVHSDFAGNHTYNDMTEWMLGNYGTVIIENDGSVEITRTDEKNVVCEWSDEDPEDDWLELSGKIDALGRDNIYYENDQITIVFYPNGNSFEVNYARK